MKRFIVAVDNATEGQRNKITSFVKGKYGYWHWYSDFWLLTSSDDSRTATSLREDLKEAVPGLFMFILEIEGDAHTWAAFGDKKHFKWLHETWVDNS